MAAGRLRRLNARGFTMVELAVVVAVIGIVMIVATPTFVTYWQTSMVKSGAQELAGLLNAARWLAIQHNQTVTIAWGGSNPGASQYKIRALVGTASTPWTTLTSDPNGWMALSNGMNVAGAPASGVSFTNLGAASSGGTYTVQNTTTGQTLSVIVAASGRVSIGP